MADVTSVDAAAVRQLNRDTLKLLVNFLLGAHAAHRQPRPEVWTSEGNDEPDGGIDALVDDSAGSEWLSRGKSVWQVKGGRTLTSSQIEGELRPRQRTTGGTEVRSEIEAGALHNQEPKPFIWTAKAADILEKVKRARASLHKVPSA